MKTIKPVIYFASAIFLVCMGCSKDFLETKPRAQATEESFYTNMDAANAAVIAAYAQLVIPQTMDIPFFMGMGCIASDDAEAGGKSSTDWEELQAFDRLTHTGAERSLEQPWGYIYKGIYFCNFALEKLPIIRKMVNKGEQAIIDVRIGEVQFLRGLYYFLLTRAYGGVPKVTSPLAVTEFEMPRSSIKEIYNLIESDLLNAIQALPERSQLDAVGRASKGAAKALLAKTYLYESSYAKNYPGDPRFGNVQQRWADALKYAEEVIGSGQYQLVGLNGETYSTFWSAKTNAYRYIFSLEGDNCPEGVFEIQHVNDGIGWFLSRGSSTTQTTTNIWYNDSLGGIAETGGWGFVLPTSDFVNEIETGDPRFATIVGQEGDSIMVGQKWYTLSLANSITGYCCRKYETGYNEFWGVKQEWSNSPLNHRLIRYAEVMLIAAEAALELGNNAKARDYINLVRTRARNSGNTGVPADLTGTITLDNLMHERRIELAMEGDRFFDLVRWKIARQKLNGKVLSLDIPVQYESPKHDFFPIPVSEIDRTNGALVQYDGWK